MSRFMTRRLHAYIDYPVALGLIVMPYVLGLGTSHPYAQILSVVTGFAAFALTILTNHETGVIKVLPYSLHLAVDAVVGVAFLIAPFLLGFSGLDAVYYWAIGATVIAVVSLHNPDPQVAA